MAPPRTINIKTSTTTITQAARQGDHQSKKQAVEEVQDLEDCSNADAMDVDVDAMDVDDEANDGEPEEFQDASEGLSQIMTKILNDQRTRHNIDKQAVSKSYKAAYTTFQTSIDALFDEYEDKAFLAHQAHFKRLSHLLAEKKKIEAAMAVKLKELHAGYDAHSRDLESVMNRRIKEMGGH